MAPLTDCEQRPPVGLQDWDPALPISREQACRAIVCSDVELPSLLTAAHESKQRFKPGVITYSRKVFIPLTNFAATIAAIAFSAAIPASPALIP